MKTKEELQKVSEELEAKLEKSEPTNTDGQEDESTVGALHKALDLLKSLVVGKPQEEAEEEEEVTEPTATERIAKSEKAGTEEVYRGLVTGESGDKVEEMVDATPVLESLVDIVAKSEGRAQATYDMLAAQDERIAALMEANAALVKGMEALYTQVQAIPTRRTSPGYVVVPTASENAPSGNIPNNFKEKVEKAVFQEKLDPRYLAWFDTRPEEAIWAALPPGALE